MRAEYSKDARQDLVRHEKYISKIKKSDGHKYQKHEIKTINDTLKSRIRKDVGERKEHNDSIFPDKYDYGCSNYKMHIDKRSHYIVFYQIVKSKRGSEYISIRKCIHSVELKKELDKENIKPLKNADPKLLLDYMTVEKEDKVKDDDLSDKEREAYKEREAELKDRIADKNKKKSKSDNDNDGEDAEVTDPETGKKVKKKRHTGERGGKYYIGKGGERVYPPEWNGHKSESKSSLIPITEYLQNSKMKSLTTYIQENL